MGKGLVMVYTGPGRNLPAAGQVFRALGRGFRVRVLSPGTGRCGCAKLASSGRFGDRIELIEVAKNSDLFRCAKQVEMSAQVLVGQASCLPKNGGQDARPTRAQLLSNIFFGHHHSQSAGQEPPSAAADRADSVPCAEARQLAREVLNSLDFHMVVLEELEDLLGDSDISMKEIEDLLAHRPPDLHVLITVGEAPSALISAADLVTEVACVKGETRKESW